MTGKNRKQERIENKMGVLTLRAGDNDLETAEQPLCIILNSAAAGLKMAHIIKIILSFEFRCWP